MQIILTEKEYSQLIRRDKINNALKELREDIGIVEVLVFPSERHKFKAIMQKFCDAIKNEL